MQVKMRYYEGLCVMEINIAIHINADITSKTAEYYFDGLLDRIRLDMAQRGWLAPDIDAWLTFSAPQARHFTRQRATPAPPP